jgi:hypothetical protein
MPKSSSWFARRGQRELREYDRLRQSAFQSDRLDHLATYNTGIIVLAVVLNVLIGFGHVQRVTCHVFLVINEAGSEVENKDRPVRLFSA